jgi:hypothetical protein
MDECRGEQFIDGIVLMQKNAGRVPIHELSICYFCGRKRMQTVIMVYCLTDLEIKEIQEKILED